MPVVSVSGSLSYPLTARNWKQQLSYLCPTEREQEVQAATPHTNRTPTDMRRIHTSTPLLTDFCDVVAVVNCVCVCESAQSVEHVLANTYSTCGSFTKDVANSDERQGGADLGRRQVGHDEGARAVRDRD